METRRPLDRGTSSCATQARGLSPRWRELPGPRRLPPGRLRGGGFLGAGGFGRGITLPPRLRPGVPGAFRRSQHTQPLRAGFQ